MPAMRKASASMAALAALAQAATGEVPAWKNSLFELGLVRPFVNNKVHVHDVAAKLATEVCKVALWKASGSDVGGLQPYVLDEDRHLGYISIIYDMLMLLPYILTKGAINDDNAGIAESGNCIPDILDEARYEVDYWLRLRDGKEYGHRVHPLRSPRTPCRCPRLLVRTARSPAAKRAAAPRWRRVFRLQTA